MDASVTSPEAQIRDILPRTWHALFGRFGRLTPIQVAAIPPLAAGRNVLIASPTASGKTEAAVAPLVERTLAARQVGIAILVLSPTRALANDLHRRLEPPLKHVGVEVATKTGDSSGLTVGDRPMLVITTPESLDSMLCRRTKDLRGVQSVVLDELHLLFGTARGDQLRCLLARLDYVADSPQRCAASATVPDLRALTDAFLGPDAVVCSPPAGADARTISARLELAASIEEAAIHIRALFDEAPGRKCLVFANTRAQVEVLAGQLRQVATLQSKVYAHHGSLARSERLRVERRFKASPSAICIATMTLEIGIDIGDVDRVVLLAPPPNVSALVQRVGRSNRRDTVTHVLGLYQSPFEQVRMEHLFECAAAGRMFGEPAAFRPDIIAQQAMSLILQNPKGWISARVVHQRLPEAIGRQWSPPDCEDILKSLEAADFIRVIDRGRYVADCGVSPLFERGAIHSVIADGAETEVVDRTTGRTVGRARFASKDRKRVASGGDVTLALGGVRRAVSHVRDQKVFVDSASGVGEGHFIARQAPRYSAGLATDFGRSIGLPPGQMWLSPLPNGRTELGHFLGSVWGKLLGWLLTALPGTPRALKADPFVLHLDRDFDRLESTSAASPLLATLGSDMTVDVLASHVNSVIADQRSRLARLLGAGPFSRHLPADLTIRWIVESVDTEAFVQRIVAATLVPGPAQEAV
ncbi:MAG: ATP-dependent Lhr-like helicase [Myxococcota bacterium]|jgi:ATP-dependent Lhr-like helicase